MVEEPTVSSSVWHWTLTLAGQPEGQPQQIAVDALGYTDDEVWTVFEDTHGTVLSRRSNTILEVRRSTAPVSHQESDAL